MCQFLSAIVCKPNAEGYCEIITDPEHTDSHNDLCEAHGLTDDGDSIQLVEYLPDYSDITNLSKWKLNVDGRRLGWFTADVEADVVRRLNAMVQAAIITDSRKILLGGWWIVAGNAVVNRVINAHIRAVRDSAKITNVRGSAQITDVRDSAQITNVRGSAQIINDQRTKP